MNVGWVEFYETHHEQLVGLAELDPPYDRASLNDAVQRAAGAARASTRRETSGSSTSGGAWCGLRRASITSGPRQPQCLFCCEGVDAVDVGGGVGARERDPEEVAERFGDELAVVDDDDRGGSGR